MSTTSRDIIEPNAAEQATNFPEPEIGPLQNGVLSDGTSKENIDVS